MVRLLQQEETKLVPVGIGGATPSWVQQAYSNFHSMLCNLERPFPCFFGAIAEEEGFLRYTYIEDHEISSPISLPDTLLEFLKTYRSIPSRSALIVFAGQRREICLEDYEKDFWNILQFLHDNDPAPWPKNIPTDPQDPLWEFCFAGEPIFINGHSPLHKRRRSRYSSSGLLLIIQTRENLKGIVGFGHPAEQVRLQIRGALTEYDSIEPSPALGIFGDPRVLEWKQYWLPDSNEARERTCPLKIRPHKTKAD